MTSETANSGLQSRIPEFEPAISSLYSKNQHIKVDEYQEITEMKKTVRLYKPDDCKEIVELFYDTVHTVNFKDYSSAQLDLWAPKEIDMDMWDKSLSNSHTVVVESNSVIIGFGS
jgi:hypothetical protein